MIGNSSPPDLDQVINAVYETSLAPESWQSALGMIAGVFNSGFADIFARTDDRNRFHGIAHGLDERDYRDEFLGVWFKRNVWGLSRPKQTAGEVVSTREMLSLRELRSSDIFVNYLDQRGLHEGMLLTIWTGNGWIQDMSLLRPFSLGPYGATEIKTAQRLLPHIQRAAAVARRLGEADAVLHSGLVAIDRIDKPAFLLDDNGLVQRCNERAERLLVKADGLLMQHGTLLASTTRASMQLGAAIAIGTGRVPGGTMAQSVRLPREHGQDLVVTVLPLSLRSDWAMMRPPAALLFVNEPSAGHSPTPALQIGDLMMRFALTQVEAELGRELALGQSIAEIAAGRRRSINTVRTQLRHLMAKVGCHRQADLILRLMAAAGPARDRP